MVKQITGKKLAIVTADIAEVAITMIIAEIITIIIIIIIRIITILTLIIIHNLITMIYKKNEIIKKLHISLICTL